MTEKMKTVCVGRYLIDVPFDAEVDLSHERIDGFEVVSSAEPEPAFRQRLAERAAALGRGGRAPAGSGAGSGPGTLVEARELRHPGMLGRIFTFGRTRSHEIIGGRRVEREWVTVEAHAHMAGRSFTLSARYVDEGDAQAADALLSRLQLRGTDEVPAAPGFCIAHAVFADPLPAHDSEQVAMHLSMPDHPDLALTLHSVAGGRPGPGLLARYAQLDAHAGADELLRVTKLRAEQRSIHGLPGEELVERIREFNFTTTYTLNWETRGAAGDVLLPWLSLEAQAGIGERPGARPAGASLHEDALLRLWDSVASSIRPRKDEPPPSNPPSGPAAPGPGAMVQAGQVCPRSGWWRCAGGGPGVDVHGGPLHYMREGERMPQALLLPRQTLWQKLKRVQPSMESRELTAWTLVDLRLRPRTAAAAAVALAPAAPAASGGAQGPGSVALGSHARTGEACPASGWWRCQEPLALDGTRWFARGGLLPAASFQVAASGARQPGGPGLIQRRSLWQLVRLADTDAPAGGRHAAPDSASGAEPPSSA